jgi:DNA topoisomerase-1
VLKDLGEHPDEGGRIEVLDGKYGPYVTHNKVNATIPKGRKPEELTVEDAIALLAERIAKGGGKTKPARKSTAKAKAERSTATGKAASAGDGETPPPNRATTRKAPGKSAAKAASGRATKSSSG